MRDKKIQLESRIEAKLLKKFYSVYRNQFQKQKVLTAKLAQSQLDNKRKWLSMWVEETNIKKRALNEKIELNLHHEKVPKFADKFTKFKRERFRTVFRAFRNQIVDRKENRNTHVKVYKLIKKSQNFRSKLKIMNLWTRRCAQRTRKYKSVSSMGSVLTNFHAQIDFSAKFEAMKNLKNLFSHLKKEDRLNFRADNLL